MRWVKDRTDALCFVALVGPNAEKEVLAKTHLAPPLPQIEAKRTEHIKYLAKLRNQPPAPRTRPQPKQTAAEPASPAPPQVCMRRSCWHVRNGEALVW